MAILKLKKSKKVVNDVQVYKTDFGDKKYKVQRKKKRLKIVKITVVCLTGMLVFSTISGFMSYREKYYNNENPISNQVVMEMQTEETREYIVEPEDSTLKEISDKDLSQVKLDIDELDYLNFKDYISNKEVYYPGEELYGVEAALEKYEQVDHTVKSSSGDLLVNNQVTTDSLYNRVLDNNKEYKKTLAEEGGIKFYEELKNKEIKEICEIIAKTVNDNIDNGLFDPVKMDSILSELKIFTDANPTNAYVTSDFCMVVNKPMMTLLASQNPGIDVFNGTIVHETFHLGQTSSLDMREGNDYSTSYGAMYRWNNLKVNPLFANWYIEAGCESMAAQYRNEDPIFYKHMIGYLESINLATILNDDNVVNQSQNSSFNPELNDIFDQFGCKTDEEKYDVVKLLYSIDILQMKSVDFINMYEEVNDKDLSEEEYGDMQFAIKNSAITTLSKHFYNNLLDKVQKENLSLQDTFYLVNIWENDINSHLKYNQIDRLDYNKEFMPGYVEMQDEFFTVIANASNLSFDEIVNLFEGYALTLDTNIELVSNSDLSWLNNDKKEYVESREDYLSKYNTERIRTVEKQSVNTNIMQ